MQGDIRDAEAVQAAMKEHRVTAVIHFAGLVEVARSVSRPDLFYEVNVGGTRSILTGMRAAAVERIVFSSNAAVYGHVQSTAVTRLISEGAGKGHALCLAARAARPVSRQPR